MKFSKELEKGAWLFVVAALLAIIIAVAAGLHYFGKL